MFFTVCNFFKLFFTVEKGQGLYCIHCARGERMPLDFFPFFFFSVEGGFGMMCVMQVLDEDEPKEVTKLVTSAKCIRRVLEKFPDVMLEELPEDFRV
jgi:hypothetical protein